MADDRSEARALSPSLLAEQDRLAGVAWDGDGETLVWLVGRGDQPVLVAGGATPDAPRDLTRGRPVRAEVGYGGGDYAVHDGVLYYAVQRTGRLFRQRIADGPATGVTPAFGQAAAPAVRPDGAWLAFVHHDDDGADRLAVVASAGGWPAVLHEGHDFYMQPRWSPDGRWLAWVAWDHPDMPWDATLLYVAAVDAGGGGPPRLGPARVVAGGPGVSVGQPEWSPDGATLYYISNETGWGHLWRQQLASGERRALTTGEAEHGTPAWIQGTATFALAPDGGHAWIIRGERGVQRLLRLDTGSSRLDEVAALAPYRQITALAAAPAGDRLALVASAPTLPPRVLRYDAADGSLRVLARASGETVDPDRLSVPRAVSWPTGAEGAEISHGLFYAPAGSSDSAPPPPLVVTVHGGPTSQYVAGWDPQAQFLASRGYAVLALNHRGSTGFGRAYMRRLYGHWGELDVEDAASAVGFLAAAGLADAERAAIMGASAGGFTVLQAMIDRPTTFAAGVCSYGVANQLTLAAQTHKFEARYNDRLIGPLPAAAALYRARSPELHAAGIRRPLALFHGSQDRVVPPAQSAAIAAALARQGTPHLYQVYEGEGHGWRRRETIEHFWTTVAGFLAEHLGRA